MVTACVSMAGMEVDDEDQLDGPSIHLPTVRPQVFECRESSKDE